MHFRQWKRREFITLLGGAAAGWPIPARAQQTRLPTIGLPRRFERRRLTLSCSGCATSVWIENRTVTIEYRGAEGRDERFVEIASEFAR
jgi:putative tryptophan/tyrosine transport system substrate-binding protein